DAPCFHLRWARWLTEPSPSIVGNGGGSGREVGWKWGGTSPQVVAKVRGGIGSRKEKNRVETRGGGRSPCRWPQGCVSPSRTAGAGGGVPAGFRAQVGALPAPPPTPALTSAPDRKSTRLNSSHVKISYAVFCLKKK